MKKLLAIFFTFLFLILTPLNLSIAETKDEIKAEIEAKRQEIKDNIETRKQETKARIASKTAERKEKLEASKLRICEQRTDTLTNRVNKVAERIEKHFNRFGVIVTKVDNFYTTKLIPNDVVVENYDELKADIATQKSEVQSLITQLKADIEAFDCASDNPKSQLETVKTDLKNVHLAMKDYRISIKNFIQAIKNAVKEKREASASAEIN